MISKEEIQKEIQAFKERHIETVRQLLIKQGSYDPMISMLVYRDKLNPVKFGIVNFELPVELFNSESGKDALAETVVPSLFDMLANNGLVPVCVSWSMEAYMRKAPADFIADTPDFLEKWQELPKEEVLVSYFESEDESEMDCRFIIREGKTINEAGDLIDTITLKDNEYIRAGNEETKIEGRFTDIFKKYRERKKA